MKLQEGDWTFLCFDLESYQARPTFYLLSQGGCIHGTEISVSLHLLSALKWTNSLTALLILCVML